MKTDTNEQKLKILLNEATKNHWEVIYPYNLILEKNKMFKFSKNDLGYIKENNEYEQFFYSLNDLVIDFEEGKTSFIEALCKDMYYDDEISDTRELLPAWHIRNMWITYPTSQRLDWLFETFKHLL